MNKYCLLTAAALAFVLPVNLANANPITGQVSIDGVDIIDVGAGTIEFIAGQNDIKAITETGSFKTALGGITNVPVTMFDEGVANAFAVLSGNLIFTGTLGATTVDMRLGTVSVTEDVVKNTLTINAPGTIDLTGFDSTAGFFTLTTQLNGGSSADVTFSATAGVPGPIVGAGLPGLVGACAGLLALARRRRREVA